MGSKGFIFLLLTGIFHLQTLHAQSFLWAKRVAITVNDDNELSVGLAIDSLTNIYVTGWFDGTNNLGGGIILTNKNGGGQDIFLAKYNSSGTLLWARRAGSNSPDRDGGRGAGVDGADNVYITGEFSGNADFPRPLSAPSNQEFFLAKYTSTGSNVWVRQSIGDAFTTRYGTGLAVDSAGNSYSVGYADNSAATIDFGSDVIVTNTSFDGYSTFLVKYDSAGNPLWAKLMGGDGSHTYATKVALDGAGNIYVRGSFTHTITIENTQLVSSGPTDDDEDMFIAKFTNAGDLLWVRRSTGANIDEGGVAVSPSGDIYVTGWFQEESTVNFDGITLTNTGNGDTFLAKYNSLGQVQWARKAGGPGLDFFWDVATDAQGNPFAAGVLSSGATSPAGTGGAVVARYNTSGAFQWSISATGAAADPVKSIVAKCAVDRGGHGYIAGWHRTSATFGTTVLPASGYWNFFLAKVVPPLTLSVQRVASTAQISITATNGSRFALDYSSTLGAGSWTNLTTNTLSGTSFTYTNTIPAGTTRRYYRARRVP